MRFALCLALCAMAVGDVRVAAVSLPGLTIQGLAVDPTDATRIYAATSAGIYRSTDGGTAWLRITPALTYNYFNAIAVDPNDPCAIYAAVYANPPNANTNAIILRSLDCGMTWGIPAGTFLGAVGVSVAVTPTTPSTFYYSFYTNGSPSSHSIVRSVGGTQTSAFTFQDGTYILATDPADPCTIVAGTIFGNVIRSTNCGPMSWSAVGGNLGSQVWGVAVHPSNHVTMLAATTGGLYRKADAASAWAPVMNISPSRVQAVAFQSGNPQVAYAGGSNGVVYKSIDGGLTWNTSSTLSAGITALAATPAPSTAVYAGGAGFITNVGPPAPIPPNTPPTIGDVVNQSIAQNTSTSALPFSIGDAESPATSLTLTAGSSDTTLVPTSGIVFGGAGNSRTVTVTPAAGQTGTATITITVSDGAATASDTFVLTVTAGPVPVQPTTVADSHTATVNVPLTVAAPGVLANDNTNGGGPMTAELVSSVAVGTLVLNANGSFTFTPPTGFTGATSFTYRAVNSVGPGNTATVSIAVRNTTDPQPPTELYAASINGNTVTLRFTAPTIGPAPTGYVLEGGLLPGQPLAVIPTGSAAPIYTLVAPTGSFYVRLRTLAGVAQSVDPSNEILIHVNVPVPPSAPANLTGLANGSSIALAWRNTFAGGSAGGVVLDVTGSINASLPLGLTDSFQFNGVPGGNYTFSLRAENAAGSSPASNAITLSFPGDGCPTAGSPLPPSGFLAYRLGNTLHVLWNPATTGPAPTSFVLNVGGSFGGSFGTPGRSLSGTVGPGTYHMSVAAENACGRSAATVAQTVVVP